MKKSILVALTKAEEVKAITTADGESVYEYLKGMLDRQNEVAKGKTDEQKKVDDLVIALVTAEGVFCSEIAERIGETSSKVSASLQRLIKAGKVSKDFDIEKKLNVYKIV